MTNLARLTLDELRVLASSVGFVDVDTAAAVAMAESGGDVTAIGDNGTSFGLWQIHTPAHPQYDPTKLATDATYNAQAAFTISRAGSNWTPWSTYITTDPTRSYRRFMPAGSV